MQKHNWHPGTPANKSPVMQILYIDSANQICTVNISADELSRFQYKILAWRDVTTAETDKAPELAGTYYWNYITGKFWPFSAKKPPNPKLPNYFKINLWIDPDKTHRLEYILWSRNH